MCNFLEKGEKYKNKFQTIFGKLKLCTFSTNEIISNVVFKDWNWLSNVSHVKFSSVDDLKWR